MGSWKAGYNLPLFTICYAWIQYAWMSFVLIPNLVSFSLVNSLTNIVLESSVMC